jgi:hypothetical protein
MSTAKDWLRKNHEEMYSQAMSTWTYMQDYTNRERMGLSSNYVQGQWFDSEFSPKFLKYQIEFEDWKDRAHRSPFKIKKFMEAETIFRTIYRQFYAAFLKGSPLVTDNDLIAMGMPARNTTRTKAKLAKTYPNYEIDRSIIRRLVIYFFDQTKKAKSWKPPGQLGAEICWAILDSPPTAISDLTNTTFVTRSPLILNFDENQRGKILYFCLRWENTRGEKGPSSEIASAIIP